MSAAGGRILVVDDEELIRTLVVRHLTGRGLACEAAADGRHALALASTGAFDVVLSDIEMPGFDGLALARELLRAAPSVPVVLLSGKASLDHAIRAMRYGVADLMQKPFHLGALDETVDRALTRRRGLREADDYRRMLQKRLEELAVAQPQQPAAPAAAAPGRVATSVTDDSDEHAEMRASGELEAALVAVVDAVEARGPSTPGHGRRTRALVSAMAANCPLQAAEIHDITWAALLHDVGILSLPDRSLVPEAQRDGDAEMIFRQHPLTGADLVRRVGALAGAAKLVEAHHEQWDGAGYPRGLKGSAIPFGAQLLAVATAADDFLSLPPERGPAELVEFLQAGVGTRFSPAAVDAFLGITAEDFLLLRSSDAGDAGGAEAVTSAVEGFAIAR